MAAGAGEGLALDGRRRGARRRWRHLGTSILFVSLAISCANGRTVETAPELPPVVAEADIAAAQADMLTDRVVTLEEYNSSFAAFDECVDDGGGWLEVQSVDPISGYIAYGTLVSLEAPGATTFDDDGPVEQSADDSGSVENLCYVEHFAYVEMVFQLTDPNVLAQGGREERAFLAETVLACLADIGQPVEEIPEIGSDEYGELIGEFNAAVQAGLCE